MLEKLTGSVGEYRKINEGLQINHRGSMMRMILQQ